MHSLPALLADLLTTMKNRMALRLPASVPFQLLTRRTELQHEAVTFLGLRL